ncbi:MAG: AAA family ATPase [Candidatus Thorarchaeota archaeon]
MRDLMSILDLDGLVHIGGDGGTGKTHLAIAIAAEATKCGHILWANTDGKGAFVRRLRENIQAVGGKRENVTLVLGHRNGAETVRNIPNSMRDDTVLVVVDTVTRVLDMSRRRPTMWGRELLEEALPILAGISHDRCVLMISESRQLDDKNTPVHHKTIKRFCDHDLMLKRDPVRRLSTILRVEDGRDTVTAEMVIDDVGLVEIRTMDDKNTGRETASSASHASA